MPGTEDPYNFLEWTAHQKRAGSEGERAMERNKLDRRKEGGLVGYRYLLLCECMILTSFVIEAVVILKHAIGN
jgi:hypothetical protein